MRRPKVKKRPPPKPPLSPHFEKIEMLQRQGKEALAVNSLLRAIDNLPEPLQETDGKATGEDL